MSPELWESFVNATDSFECEPLWLGRDTENLAPMAKGQELDGVVVELSPEVCNGSSPGWETFSAVPKAGLPVFSGSDTLAETYGCARTLTGADDLTQWMGELATTPGTEPHSEGVGTIVVIVGPPGSPGRTTLAINLAAECAQLSNHVILVDADVYSPSVSQLLGLSPEGSGLFFALRSARVENVDIAAVLSHAQHYTGATVGFTVLTGLLPVQQKKPVDQVAFERTLACLKAAGFTVVADTSAVLGHGHREGSAGKAWEVPQLVEVVSRVADVVVAITHPTDLGISRLVRSWELLSPTIPHENFHLVMRDSPHAPARERNDGSQAVWEYTGLEKIAVLGDEGAGLWRAQKSHVTLADISKESSARGVVGALAKSIVGQAATAVKKPAGRVSLGSMAQRLASRFNRSR
jgi:hypothetical protein